MKKAVCQLDILENGFRKEKKKKKEKRKKKKKEKKSENKQGFKKNRSSCVLFTIICYEAFCIAEPYPVAWGTIMVDLLHIINICI